MEQRFEQLLLFAISKKATDIHIQLSQKKCIIQCRGLAGFIQFKLLKDDEKLYDYLKYRSNLDLSMTMTPQTGSFEYYIQHSQYFLRFSALETHQTRSGVLRILNLVKMKGLQSLTQHLPSIKNLQKLAFQKDGLILFCGSTGSGKSTTMFTCLNDIEDKRIYTLEDPIEQYYERLVQIQINLKQGLTYEEGLNQLLRHDPDILVIGEIRQGNHAEMAIRCAYTGHLVFATIHASSLEHCIARLLDLNINQFDIENTVLQIIFQRLVLNQKQNNREATYEFYNKEDISRFFKTHPYTIK